MSTSLTLGAVVSVPASSEPVDPAALVEENAALRAAVTVGMHYLRGRYPIPVREKVVLAQMQAALDLKKKRAMSAILSTPED